MLNEGEHEFILGLLLMGDTRTKIFEGLPSTFSPTLTDFSQIERKTSLTEWLGNDA